eukprot:g4296.t1
MFVRRYSILGLRWTKARKEGVDGTLIPGLKEEEKECARPKPANWLVYDDTYGVVPLEVAKRWREQAEERLLEDDNCRQLEEKDASGAAKIATADVRKRMSLSRRRRRHGKLPPIRYQRDAK